MDRLPDMADFAVWATACETALWPAGTFARAYAANRRAAIESIIEADPVAACVRAIMAERSSWTGSAADLLRVGADLSSDGISRGRADWPTNPRALAGRLRRAQTFLRTLGIEVASSREGRAGTRMISVSTSAEPTVSTVSGLRHQASEAATEACRIEHGLTKSGRCLLWRTSSAGWGCFEAMLTVLTQTPPFVSGNSAAFKSGRDHDLVAWGRSLRFLNMSGQRRQGRL